MLWAALYFVAGDISHRINGPFFATGYIWLPAGVTMAAFMLAPARRWLVLGLGFFAAQMVLGWTEGRDPLRMLLFSVDEIGSAVVAVALVRQTRFSLEGLAFVRALLIAGAVSGAISALFGAGWFWLALDVPFWHTAQIWSAADVVGVLIVTPVLASWSRFRAMRSGGIDRADFLFGLLAFAALVVTTVMVFDGRGLSRLSLGLAYALTYIPLFLAAVVTLLWGGRGASLAVATLAVFVLMNTAQGDGPFAETAIEPGRSLLEAQLYLAVAALLTLLISTFRTSRELQHEQAALRQNDIALALAASSQLFYVLDPRSGAMRWTGDLQRVLQLAETDLSSLDAVLTHVHADDREPLRARWVRQLDGEPRPDMRFRLMLPSGTTLVAVDMSSPLLDGDESVAMIGGAWRLQMTAPGELRAAE